MRRMFIQIGLKTMPYTLHQAVHHTLIIKKSQFIACVEPMADRQQAQQRVQQLWAEHPQAAHICWALLAGGQSAAVDDGEPSGTAGRPMLDVLRHQQLDGVLATVVRYFGGVKLGAGGLVRAYTDSVAQALLQAEKIPVFILSRLQCAVPYALEGVVRRVIAQHQLSLEQVSHGQQVQLTFSLKSEQRDSIQQQLNELCHGQILWQD